MLLKKFQSEAYRVRKHKIRAHRKGRAATLKTSEWLYLLIVFENRCAYCGAPAETMDHVVPIGAGGGTTKTNVLPCCLACNKQKGTAVWLPALAGGSGVVVRW